MASDGEGSAREVLRAIIGGPMVAYSPRLAVALGDVKMTVMLSQLVYWQDRLAGDDGWFYRSVEALSEDTGLSKYEQQGARDTLVKLGLLDADRRGVPPHWHYRVNVDSLIRHVSYVMNLLSPDGRPPVLQTEENPPFEGRESLPLNGGKSSQQVLKRVKKEKKEESVEDSTLAVVENTRNAIRKALEVHFSEVTKLRAPLMDTEVQRRSAGHLWWAPLREIAELTDWNLQDAKDLISAAIKRLEENRMTIACPRSILKTAQAIMAEVGRGSYVPADMPDGFRAVQDYLKENGHGTP